MIESSFPDVLDRIGGVVIELPPRVREVTDSIPGWVVPNTLKIVVMAAFLGAQSYRFSALTD